MKKIVKKPNMFKKLTNKNSNNLDQNLSKIIKKDDINKDNLNNLSKIENSNNNKYKTIAKTNSLITKKIYIKY